MAISEGIYVSTNIIAGNAAGKPHLASEKRRERGVGADVEADAVFVPALAGFIQGCMEELQASMLDYTAHEDEQWQLPLVVRIAIAHAQFETIHPFTDGNGRVGRLLMPLMLAAEGLPPLYVSGALLRHRRSYYDGLADIQLRGEWSPWIQLFCRSVTESCDNAIAIATDLNALHDQWAEQLSELRADATARKLPRFMLGHPVVSATQIADAFGVSFVAANKAIEQLVARKILMEPTQRRIRVFHATKVLSRLQRP